MRHRDQENAAETEREANLATPIEMLAEKYACENCREHRLCVGDDRSDARGDELGGVKHAEEPQAGSPQADEDQNRPDAYALRHGAAKPDGQRDEHGPRQESPKGGKGQMG